MDKTDLIKIIRNSGLSILARHYVTKEQIDVEDEYLANKILLALDKTEKCCCGEPTTLGVVHRKDNPCYIPDKTEKEFSITIRVSVDSEDNLVEPIEIDGEKITNVGIYLIKGIRYWVVIGDRKTEKEWCECIKTEEDTKRFGGWHIGSEGLVVCNMCGLKIGNDSVKHFPPKPSPAKLPEKFRDFRGDHTTYLLAYKIDEIIDWAKGVEERIK